MINQIPIFAGLLMGILGSAHCVGMCGPLLLPLGFQHNPLRLSRYFAGKTIAYITLGLAISAFATGFNLFTFQRYFSLGFGLFMLLLAIHHFYPIGFLKNNQFAHTITTRISQFLSHNLQKGHYFGIGFANGLLPCGLVFMALGTAAIFSQWWQILTFMLGFGIGTSPALLALVLFKKRFAHHAIVQKIIPALFVFSSLLLVLRGLNLNIPYISPAMHVAEPAPSCCHPK